MKRPPLSLVAIGGCLLGLGALLAVVVDSGLGIRAQQAALADLFALRSRLDDFSVASDNLLLYGADPALHGAYRTEAEALQVALRALGEDYPDARKAAHHIDVIVDSVAMALAEDAAPSPPDGAGPLALPSRSRIIMSQVAGHGIALDTALDDVLRERREAIQGNANRIGAGLAGALLLFGALSVIAFMLIRRRAARPARELRHTLDRIRAGDTKARAPVAGADELARLSATLNRSLDERQAADEEVAAQRRKLEATLADLEATRDRLVRAQEVGQIGSWDVDLARGRLEWSDQVFQIFGIAEDEFGGTEEAFFELVHPEDREWLREERARWLASGGDLDAEHRILRPDGEVRWVRERARSIPGSDGKPAFTTGTVQDVSARHRLLEEIRQFQTLLENTEDLCAIVDNDYRFLWVNRAYARQYGRSQEAIVGRHVSEILGEDFFADVVKSRLDRCLAGDPQRFEAERDYPGLGRRNLLVRYQPIDSPAGTGCRVAALITDISDVKKAEVALEEHARLLEMAGRAARFGAWSVDLAEGDITWSDAVADIHGRPPGYAPNLEEGVRYYAPEYRERIRELFTNCAEKGEPYDEELRIIDAHGRSVWVRALGEPVRDRNGAIVRVEGAFQDVTRRREQEAMLRQLSQIVEQSPAAIVVTDLQGRIEYVNPAFEAVSGYPREEAVGRTPALLKSGRTPESTYRELWQTIESGRAWAGELQNLRRDGELYWESQVISPLTDEHGRSIKYVAIKTDVTEYRKVREQLQQAQKMEAVGNLAGGIAHDFNNLLGVVLGNLQLADRRLHQAAEPDSTQVRTRLQTAMDAVTRGAELSRRLLSFSRNTVLESRIIDLNELVAGMREMLARSLGEAIDIRMKAAEGLWPASLDPGLTENVLLNLALNARDAMPAGGMLTIETANISLEKTGDPQSDGAAPGDYVMLAVTDTGTGMPPEVRQRVFEPFFSTKEPGKGSGLGLSMVYGIVRQSGGHVDIYSEEGTGTTVRVYFPRAEGEAEPVSGEAEGAGELIGGSEVVLVVEDDPRLRDTAVQSLRELGYRVLEAGSGPRALEILAAEPGIDLLFTDVVMPGGLNGEELAGRARELRPGLPVLLTSGYTTTVLTRERLRDLGGHLLRKPYAVEELARRVREALDADRGR